MKLLILSLMFSLFAQAAPLKDAALWNNCLQGYKATKSKLFDVVFDDNSAKNILFRNGKYLSPEALNIFHKSQFWTTELKIENGFYAKKNAVVIMGDDKYCLNQEFNWVRADTLSLLPFNEKTCNATITHVLTPADATARPSVEDVLMLKMSSDLKIAMVCLDKKRSEACDESQKDSQYLRLLKWNTQACEKIDNPKLQSLIAEKKRIVAEYSAQFPKQEAPEPSKKETPKASGKPKVKI